MQQHIGARPKQENAERLAEYRDVDRGRRPRRGKRRERPERDRRAHHLTVEIAVFPVLKERHSRRRQEVEEVDALRLRLVDAEKERHEQEQQRPATDAPRREDARAEARERGQKPVRHRSASREKIAPAAIEQKERENAPQPEVRHLFEQLPADQSAREAAEEIRQRRRQGQLCAPIPQRRRHRAHRKNDRHAGGECLLFLHTRPFRQQHEQRNAAAPTENAVRKSCGDAAEAVLRFLLHVPHSLCKKRPRRFFAYFLRKLWQSVHWSMVGLVSWVPT